MKNTRKKILGIASVCMFIAMMMFSVSTSVNGTNFSFSGMCVLANGSSCYFGSCAEGCPPGTECDSWGGECCLEVCTGGCTGCFGSECTGGETYCGMIIGDGGQSQELCYKH